mmetsp:Transcript_43081/g.89993  ORF Transcript_43081/g.89993 Transcript_43081/m.89993 type:complete len:201 (+) Transcript_43081:120-722(+)
MLVEGFPHARDNLFHGLLPTLLGALEHHLVVNLQDESVAQLLELLRLFQLEHGERHDVGGAALDGRVDRRPLEVRAHVHLAGGDAYEGPPPPHEGARVSRLSRVRFGLLLPREHLGPVGVPRLEHGLRLGDGDAPVLGEAVRRLAVGDGEVERLGLAPLRAEDVLEQRRGRRALGVVPLEQTVAAINSLAHVLEHAHRRA